MALGLGRLNVLSALGEPLRADIDVTSLTPEEASTLQLKIASPDAYRAAGVDYNAILGATQVALARRADGRPYMRLTSDRAVTEPFVDVILEMTWASGRLVREYTLLLDPPKAATAAVAAAPAAAPVVSPAPRPAPAPAAAAAPSPAPAPVAQPAAPASAPARRTPAPRAVAAPAAASAPAVAGANQVKVRPGDTLSGIAARAQPAGVSLDQMLVALLRGNPQAFVGNNMNRLRAGAVLSVPSADDVRAIAPSEARETIVAQSADFDAYRRKLAGGVPMAGEAPSRQATGKVQAAVEDRKQAAAPTPDKLKLSQGAVKAGTTPEAQVSKDTASKEASARVAELARNVEELKKLQGSTATVAAAPASAAAAAAKPAPATAAVTVPVPVPAPAVAAASVPEPVPAPPQVAAAPAPAAAAKPAASGAAPKVPPPMKGDEPGFVDSMLDSPFMLPGAGVLALVLAGVGVYRMRGRNRKAGGETSFLESRLQPDSFFGNSGGQRVDTHEAGGASVTSSNSSSMSYSLSQLDAIGDVDPVAEADVYLAYGRDLQAEEILKEAMRATPERLAIRTKLLEVYAKRRDTKGFELLATQLFALTKGSGEDWSKAQELGRSIDPDNALYQPGGEPDAVVHDGDRFIEPLGASTLPQSVMPSPSGFQRTSELVADAPVSQSGVDLDIDLGFDGGASSIEPAAPSAPEDTRPYAASAAGLSGFDLTVPPDLPDLVEPAKPVRTTDLPTFKAPAAAPAADGALNFDLGDISLDLDAPATAGPRDVAAEPKKVDSSYVDFDLPDEPDSRFNEDGDPLERKIELADEFRQIGDHEGARDLLEEVIAQAEEGALKAKAQTLLDSLG